MMLVVIGFKVKDSYCYAADANSTISPLSTLFYKVAIVYPSRRLIFSTAENTWVVSAQSDLL